MVTSTGMEVVFLNLTTKLFHRLLGVLHQWREQSPPFVWFPICPKVCPFCHRLRRPSAAWRALSSRFCPRFVTAAELRLCWCPSRPVAKDEPPTLVKNGPKTGEGGKNDEGFDFVKTPANNLELACVQFLSHCTIVARSWSTGPMGFWHQQKVFIVRDTNVIPFKSKTWFFVSIC